MICGRAWRRPTPPEKTFADYDQMLADPALDAVIIATADAFHVPAAIKALKAGKHVLCEKPAGISIEETALLAELGVYRPSDLYGRPYEALRSGDPAGQSLYRRRHGPDGGAEGMVAADSSWRYPMTDALQPLIASSAQSKRPLGDPKADKQRY